MEEGKGSSALNSSMTDLMTSLAVIFILLLVASLNNAYQQGQTAKSTVLEELKRQLANELTDYGKEGFVVKDDPNDPLGLLIIVPDGLLNFKKNDSRVPKKGVEFLTRIIPRIAKTVCSKGLRRNVSSIVVEGHTDSDGNDLMNLTLSQSRSMGVVAESVGVLQGRYPKENRCFIDLLSATGRGEMELVYSGVGRNRVENKNKSRRVVFKIRVRSEEEKILNTVAK